MAYETQTAQLARVAVRHHGELKEVIFISGNKDYSLVFADGTVLTPSDDGSLKHEYETGEGYGEIAQALGGTHPYSLLAFGYQGTGPGCFANFLKTAGFEVTEADIVAISPPARLQKDGTPTGDNEDKGADAPKEAETTTPAATSPAAVEPSPAPAVEAAAPSPEPAVEAAAPSPEPAPVAEARPAAQPLPAADWYEDPMKRHQYRYWDGSSWTDHVADNGVAALDPLNAGAPAVAISPVQFDDDGHVRRITFPDTGSWSVEHKGQYTYYVKNAGTLLEATEFLRAVANIPGLTYYTVETPDGSLGRDMNGFYTDGPLKTSGLRLATSAPVPAPTGFEGLTDPGNAIANQSVVANLKQQGQYAKFILQMECGRCGYKSPVETEGGDLTRQCYACGAENTGMRGTINVFVGNGQMIEV
jgi:hypothetical protein